MAGSEGAEFADDLAVPASAEIVSKATTPEKEAYSDFEDTDLAERLRALGVRRLLVGGLATDYCVLATVIDGLKEGFEVLLLSNAVRAVDVHDGDGERAIAEMRSAGATVVSEESGLP